MAMLFRTSDSSAYVAQRFVPLSVPLFILVFLSSCEAAGAESATFLAAREKYDRREYLAAMGLRGGTVKTGREKEVAEVLSRTVELDPSHLKARLHLGRT
ncbi:MAG: hypothetical protein FJW26_05720, partial [Acidimicrobiia bacterium]|nr:hypothetical protein [Acidimicrobiia bacterium]